MKRILKRVCDILAMLLVSPMAIVYYLLVAAAGAERTFPGFSQLAALWPGLTGVYLRRAFYRFVLPECGADSHIGFGTIISHPTARIGRGVYVGPFCLLGDVTLERDVLLGSNVSIINGNRQHGIDRLDVPVRDQPGEYPHIIVGEDAWMGDRALVMAHVGKHSIVGAGSVVTRTVPEYSIVVGNPARIAGWRCQLADSPNPSAASGVLEATHT
jgi:acetyltransferase-like isoleucine patch superfamily enzyme